jgi:hypothetical protein
VNPGPLFYALITSFLCCPPASIGQEANTNAASQSDLARAVCQTCHLYPEPLLLDKHSWANALRQMAPLLGVGKIDLDRRPDGKILREAAIFPPQPLISEADWRQIVRFYSKESPEVPLPQKSQAEIELENSLFQPHAIIYSEATALTSLVRIDKDRFFIGNAGKRSLDIVSLDAKLLKRVEMDSAPVDLTIRPEGVYVTLIGDLFPSDERKGKIVLVTETNGLSHVRTILDGLARPTSANFLDLNNDGREDLVLCAFGNFLGQYSWYERTDSDEFRRHVLLEQPGAVNSVFRHDSKTGTLELYLLTAQAREGIHRFRRNGQSFDHQVLAEFHPAFGSSHLELADFNRDGFPDLLVTNGDNGDYPSRLKSYHGVRIYLNDQKGNFREHWFYAMNGAFKALAADFDGDGDLDIAAISFFPDYQSKPQESFVYFENLGEMRFRPRSFSECVSGRWLTMDAGDVDGDGDIDLVLGSFADGPASVPIPPELSNRWRSSGYSVLWLENTKQTRSHAR